MITHSPVRLALHEKPKNGGVFIRDATDALKMSWRRSIADIGGYWIGRAEYIGPTEELLDVFQNGMLWELRETAEGMLTWQGFIGEMTLIHKGQRYLRSWNKLANRVKVSYSKIGHNQISNNSCEEIPWAAYGTPSKREMSTTWRTHGNFSCHVVTDAANEGVIIQSSIAIDARKDYQAQITVFIVSGTWRLEIYRPDDSMMDFNEQAATGQSVMSVGISEDNDFAGNVGLRLYCIDPTGEIYADACVFQLAPTRAETNWYADYDSQAEYGVIESVVSQSGMTDEAANALAMRTLYDRRWAKTWPPDFITEADTSKTKLDITFLGYVFTLNNKYTLLNGANECATLINSLLTESEFVQLGAIWPNTMYYNIEDYDFNKIWDLMRRITEAGDEDGNRWVLQVLGNKKLYYQKASDLYIARLRGGRMVDSMGGPLRGYAAQPGLVAVDDLPRARDFGVLEKEDRSNTIWMSEVEWNLGNFLQGKDDLSFRRTET